MNIFSVSSVVFLMSLFLFPTPKIFANVGGHESDGMVLEEPVAIDSMYAIKEDKVNPLAGSNDRLDKMFSPTDLFTQDELIDSMDDKKMEVSHNEHAGHQVELSHHEMVSYSSKGFGTAIGITLFAGLAFTGLTFMRPGE